MEISSCDLGNRRTRVEFQCKSQMARVEGNCLIDILNHIANACHIFFLSFKKHTPSMGPMPEPFPGLTRFRSSLSCSQMLFSSPARSRVERCLAYGLLSRNSLPALLLQQSEQEPNTHVQLASQLIEDLLSLRFRSFCRARIGQTPMNRRRVSPGGTPLANPITERDHAIKRLTHKPLQGFGHGLAHLDAPSGKRADRQRMDRLGRMTPGTQRLDLSLAQVTEERLGHLRAGAVARTEKQKTRWGTVKVPLRAAPWGDR